MARPGTGMGLEISESVDAGSPRGRGQICGVAKLSTAVEHLWPPEGENMLRALILCVLCAGPMAHAAIDDVPRDRTAFPHATDSPSVRVPGVRVVMADYELIARDFPMQRRRPGEQEGAWKARVDAWLVSETGFILVEQTKQEKVNSKIPVTEQTKLAFRPKGYNRAHVISVHEGLMDAKGTGTHFPAQRHHGNGLATLGEMIREYIYEKMVQAVMNDAKSGVRTVGGYAVLDYGFDVIHQDGSRDRAGYILRQAHIRATGMNSSLSREDSIMIEKTLRRYGLTSSGETYAFRNNPLQASTTQWDYTNIQGTKNSRVVEIIDFGAFLAVDSFKYNLVSNYDLHTPVLRVGTPEFIQPDPALRASLEQWGTFDLMDPKADKPWVWSHELARAWAEGRADRAAAERHIENMVGPVLRKLGAPGTCHVVF